MQNFIHSKLLVPLIKDGTKKYVDLNLSGGTEEEVDKMIGDIQIVIIFKIMMRETTAYRDLDLK